MRRIRLAGGSFRRLGRPMLGQLCLTNGGGSRVWYQGRVFLVGSSCRGRALAAGAPSTKTGPRKHRSPGTASERAFCGSAGISGALRSPF